MPYTFMLTSMIPASAREIYDTWLDSLGHSEMTGGEARMSDVIGAEVSAWDGYISGRNLELVPGERIVQSWRTTKFTDEHEDSIVTVLLEDTGDGTLLTLVHSNVPDDQRSYEEGGWQSNYFEPMQAYFRKRRGGAGARSPKKTARRAARTASGAGAPRTSTASGRGKTKRGAAAKASSKHAGTAGARPGRHGSAKRKPGRRKRR